MFRTTRAALWLLCCLALALRVSGMHMHLDAAHGEASLGVHLAHVGVDDAYHHESHASDHPHDAVEHPGEPQHAATDHGHASVDIGLENQALGKKGADEIGLWLVAAVLLCLLCAPRELRLSRQRSSTRKPERKPHLRPPLRGPPAYA